MARLVIFFLLHSAERIHLRELRRQTDLPSASLQRELRRLVEIGVLRREDESGRAYFTAEGAHPAWRGWALLLRSAAPEAVLHEALAAAPGLAAAFIYGSSARGDADSQSDIDLFLLLKDGAREKNAVRERLSEVELLLSRPLDIFESTPELARARLQDGNAFFRRVFSGPKQWIVGPTADLHLGIAA